MSSPPETTAESTATGPVVLEVRQAVKRYGTRRALDGLDLILRRGQWMGLLGPNGAGKTTAMRAMAGLLPIDGGRLELLGKPVDGPRPEAVGWVPQHIALYPALTGRENLQTFGALHGLHRHRLRERIAWALDWSGLDDAADRRISTYSGGMQRRLNIACAVLHGPSLLLLDEPTVGVDPQARERIFGMLDGLRRDGVAILHSSHAMDDLEAVCDTSTILDSGRCVAAGAVADLLRQTFGEGAQLEVHLGADLDHTVQAALRAAGFVPRSAARWTRQVHHLAVDLPQALQTIQDAGAHIVDLHVRRPGLRELFFHLTGRELRP